MSSINKTGHGKNFAIETECSRYVISPKGEIVSFADKASGRELLAEPSPFAMLYRAIPCPAEKPSLSGVGQELYLKEEETPILPKAAELKDGVLTVTFEDGYSAVFRISVRDEYFTVELQTELDKKYKTLVYSKATLRYEIEDDRLCAVVYLMNINTLSSHYPDPREQALEAKAFSQLGTEGSKIAIIACPRKELIAVMKKVGGETDPALMPVSKAGGPYAEEVRENHGTYVIISDVDDGVTPEDWSRKYQYFGVNQIDFHQGLAFRQGDFHFRDDKYKGSAAEFKRAVTDPLKKAGFISGLHTYAFYISPACTKYTADPKWQRQLEVIETFTLGADIDAQTDTIPAAEDVSGVSTVTGFFVPNSLYLLIDEELIKFTRPEGNHFYSCERGLCGTQKAPHQKGAKIKHMTHMFFLFCPQLGSELFYEVARNTARAYNEGGFGMIYLDALDGITRHSKDFAWYYASTFVHEIINHCSTPPLIEYSTMYQPIWYCRSRMGAWDAPTRGYKNFIFQHVTENDKKPQSFNLPKQLGWYFLYPAPAAYPAPPTGGNYAAYQTKYMFLDDVDFLGARAVAYDTGLSFLSVTEDNVKNYPALMKNAARFLQYETLRNENYFPESIKRQIRDNKDDFALIEKKDGGYAFVRKQYSHGKIYSTEPGRNAMRGSNPYQPQAPFLRIEALYSALPGAAEETVLIRPEGGAELSTLVNPTTFSPCLDLSGRQALRLKVYGNRSDDYLCVQLTSPKHMVAGGADFVIKLDFDGWREFILAGTDNGEYPDLVFEGKRTGLYFDYREKVHFNAVETAGIYRSGACDGVKVEVLSAVECLDNPIVNPTLSINGQSLTFECVIDSGKYLEYDGVQARVYDTFGNFVTADSVSGALNGIRGDFEMTLTSENKGAIPVRARLTAGFTGDELR